MKLRGPIARQLALLPLAALAACAADDDRPATWRYIHAAIIVPSCSTAACHSEMSRSGGMDFMADDACVAVKSRLTGALLRGLFRDLPRMPPDQPLPEADIELIERWLELDLGVACE